MTGKVGENKLTQAIGLAKALGAKITVLTVTPRWSAGAAGGDVAVMYPPEAPVCGPVRKVSVPRTHVLNWLGLSLLSVGLFGLLVRQYIMGVNQERVDGSADEVDRSNSNRDTIPPLSPAAYLGLNVLDFNLSLNSPGVGDRFLGNGRSGIGVKVVNLSRG